MRFGNFTIDTDVKVGVTFINHETNESIYFQPGDETGDFFDEFDKLEAAYPDVDYAILLARLWERYQP